jgi:hypothetical protein
MLVLALPMIFAYTALGLCIGLVIGSRRWGKLGAVLLGTFLGITPAIAGYVVFAWGFAQGCGKP